MAEQLQLKKWVPYTCQICGERYHRRDYFESWTVARNGRSGALVYEKAKIRLCLGCVARGRHTRFLRGPDLKLLIGEGPQ